MGWLQGASLYDRELQMFCEPAREPQLGALLFLRWLAEQGRLEHLPYNGPSGEYAEAIGEEHERFNLAFNP
jgi:hypothetical protein